MAARYVHMAGETNTRHRVVPTCHTVGWVAPLVHVADSHGSGWSQSTTVTFGLNQSCVCNITLQLTKGHLSEPQDPLDIDQRLRTAVLNIFSDLWQLDVYTWQARQYSSQSRACHAVGWVALPLWCMLPTAMGLAGAEVVCVCVCS